MLSKMTSIPECFTTSLAFKFLVFTCMNPHMVAQARLQKLKITNFTFDIPFAIVSFHMVSEVAFSAKCLLANFALMPRAVAVFHVPT